ncbi:MAG: T9SS type A sorting domain-containing protein [Bacteroidia bacterium]|nr:T9SS type A sorting domain-containing protein [Bacteroidia bacterium]
MKNIRLHLFLLAMSCLLSALAQVPKKIMVEHFTNTKCSICASRNPGFYSNLNAQSNVVYLSIHPSSPYVGCLLYQQNPSENDARTNFYGIYGGTPRLVLNGSVISPTVNYSDNSLFTPYQQQTSPAQIKITQTKYGSDSIRARVVVKTVATHSLGALNLFIALAEDTVFYTGSNGEPKHFNVCRKTLSSTLGWAVTLPATIGDSVVISVKTSYNPVWNFSRINTLAILQESSNNNLVQCESYSTQQIPMSVGENTKTTPLVFYPNPGKGIFQFEAPFPSRIEIKNYLGQIVLVKESVFGANVLDLSDYSNSLYIATLQVDGRVIATTKLVLAK